MTGSLFSGCGGHSGTSSNPGTNTSCAKLTDIDHVVIFIQENRSFDHYFGSYRRRARIRRSERGLQAAVSWQHIQRAHRRASAFPPRHHQDQLRLHPRHYSRLDPAAPELEQRCNGRLRHLAPRHQCQRRRARPWATTRAPICLTTTRLPTLSRSATTTAAPSSGPPIPIASTRWLHRLTPTAKTAGPCCRRSSLIAPLVWQAHLHHHARTTAGARHLVEGLSTPDASAFGSIDSDNVLPYFKNFQDPTNAALQERIRTPFSRGLRLPTPLAEICRRFAGSSARSSPPIILHRPSLFGENTLSAIVTALTANPVAWAKTVLFITYDENGGFFDHVAPVTAPPGTAGRIHHGFTRPRPNCRRLHHRTNRPRLPRAHARSSRPSAAAASSLLTSSITHRFCASSRHASAPKFRIFPHGAAPPWAT